jgi:fatty acid desaturase
MRLTATQVFVMTALLAVDLAARFVVWRYYADSDRVLRLLKLLPAEGRELGVYYKKYDEVLAPLPFIWTWIEIVLPVMLAASWDNPLGWLLLAVWVGGRFRALQEFGHNAVHFALCRSRGWQWTLADFFFQAPAFKTDIYDRQIRHTRQHHRNPNDPERDPNRRRVRDGGMVPPLMPWQFYLRLLNPLRPSAVAGRLAQLYRDSLVNHRRRTIVLRVLSLATSTTVLVAAGGWKGVAFGWLVPLATTYAVFVWLALLAEHRWFVDGPRPNDRMSIEFQAGRPTDYTRLSGAVVRVLVSPTSDAYHLAHSLYPAIRWNYLPAIDRALKIAEPRYTEHASEGLILDRGGIPSALSELRDRLVHAPAALEKEGVPA